MQHIGVIGAGNMGSALIKGLVQSQKTLPENIWVFDVDREKTRGLQSQFGIRPVDSLDGTIGSNDAMLVLAVKPQIIAGVLETVATAIHDDLVVISIAAGISTKFILSSLKRQARLIRAMPNAAAIVGKSATALCRAGTADESDLEKARDLFSAFGDVVVVDEKMMNTVTALASSGLAYIFVIMEALTDAGVKMGLDRATARELTVQTVMGAAHMAASGKEAFSELKDRITSPGGTTIAGLAVMERSGMRGVLMDTVEAATRRAAELEPPA